MASIRRYQCIRTTLALVSVACLALFHLPGGLCANYYIVAEHYDIQCLPIDEYIETPPAVSPLGSLRVSHRLKFYCFEGSISSMNITVPYPLWNLTKVDLYPYEALDCFVVYTTAGRPLEFDVAPLEDATIVKVVLPEVIYAGDDFTFQLSYYVSGAVAPANLTYWDKFLKRGGNWKATFHPTSQRVRKEELKVEMTVPQGSILKTWGPKGGLRKYDSNTEITMVVWESNRLGEERGEYFVVFGEAGVGGTAILVLVLIGTSVFILLLAIAYVIRIRYGHTIEEY